jgi:hypothetical protein
MHTERHPPSRAEAQGERSQQDLLPCEGHQLAGTRAADSDLQVRCEINAFLCLIGMSTRPTVM